MEKDNFFSLIWQGSQDLSISLGNAEMELFWIYLKELLEWNAKLNLTAVTDPKEIIIKHFIDSLTPLPYLERAGPLLDIGSGAFGNSWSFRDRWDQIYFCPWDLPDIC